MSTPRPFHYCRVCYRNFTDYEWKKHRFNPRHKQRLEDKLASVEVALEHLLSPTDDVTPQDLEFDVASFECYFCEDYSPLKNTEDEGEDNTRPNITTLWKHLAGKKHKTAVQQYFADYTPPALYQPYRYWLKKAMLKYKLGLFTKASRARDHHADLPLTPVTVQELSSPNTLTHPSDSVTDSTPTREARTVWSKDGIAQNPTGWHQGTRVWRGGIVKSRAQDWRTWSSDLDAEIVDEHDSSVLGESVHHVTVARTAHNKLATIQVDPELPKKGNIHTGARPPWEIEDDEPAGVQLGPTINLLAIARQKQRIQNKNPNRVGAEHANRVRLEQQGVSVGEQADESDPHWLPKFGRVFNAGSRADSRKEFEREQRKRKLDQR